MAPVAHQHDVVAAVGLVHHVAAHEQRRAGIGQVAEVGPELAAQHRVEADRGLVQHQQPWPAEQRGGQRDTRPLTAGEAADRAVGAGGQVDRRDRLGHALIGSVEHAGEVVEVLAGGQVEVDRGRLGDVTDVRTQAGRPGRQPQHVDLARRDDLHADDRAHQRRLAASAGTQQPRDTAGRHLHRHAVEHTVAAAVDHQIADADRGLAHGHAVSQTRDDCSRLAPASAHEEALTCLEPPICTSCASER